MKRAHRVARPISVCELVFAAVLFDSKRVGRLLHLCLLRLLVLLHLLRLLLHRLSLIHI